MSEGTKYTPQKKYLKKQKQLRVWISEEKYALFQQAVAKSGTSIYSVIKMCIRDSLPDAKRCLRHTLALLFGNGNVFHCGFQRGCQGEGRCV